MDLLSRGRFLHQSVFSGIAGGRPVGVSFPLAVDYAAISDAVNGYIS